MNISDVVARVRHWISGSGAEPPAGKHLTVYQSSGRDGDGRLYSLVSLEAKAETASRYVQAALAGVGAFFDRAGVTISRLFAHIREASARGAAMTTPGPPGPDPAPQPGIKENARAPIVFIDRAVDLTDVSAVGSEPAPDTSIVDVVRGGVPVGPPHDLVGIVATAAPKSSRSPQVGETGEVFTKTRNKLDGKTQVLVTPAAQVEETMRPTKIKEKLTVPADVPSPGAPANLFQAALALELHGEPIRKKGKIKQFGKQIKSVLRKVKNGVEKKTASATRKAKKTAAGTAGKVALKSWKTPASTRRKVSDN